MAEDKKPGKPQLGDDTHCKTEVEGPHGTVLQQQPWEIAMEMKGERDFLAGKVRELKGEVKRLQEEIAVCHKTIERLQNAVSAYTTPSAMASENDLSSAE